jgi:hypothetical protein
MVIANRRCSSSWSHLHHPTIVALPRRWQQPDIPPRRSSKTRMFSMISVKATELGGGNPEARDLRCIAVGTGVLEGASE